MNFNDIQARLDRLYASLGLTRKSDLSANTNFHTKEDGSWGGISFGTRNEAENELAIFTVISNIADLKDNLKKAMVRKGLDATLVTTEIKTNLALQLIMDLDNKHKHGEPLSRPEAPIDVQIANVSSALSIQIGSWDGGVSFDLLNGKTSVGDKDKAAVVIDADIIDTGNNVIMTFDKMVKTSIIIWETFIDTHSLS